MKKMLTMMLTMLIASVAAMAQDVEVLYFHGKQRCKACIAIEKETKAAVKEMKDCAVLRIVDISTSEGKALARKYKVTWSSLFVVDKAKGGKTENLTQFAFANARSNPAAFRKELKTKIRKAAK